METMKPKRFKIKYKVDNDGNVTVWHNDTTKKFSITTDNLYDFECIDQVTEWISGQLINSIAPYKPEDATNFNEVLKGILASNNLLYDPKYRSEQMPIKKTYVLDYQRELEIIRTTNLYAVLHELANSCMEDQRELNYTKGLAELIEDYYMTEYDEDVEVADRKSVV